MKVLIIVPSYNEGKVIRDTILTLIPLGFEILIIDDCSTDNTYSVIKDLPVYYIRHEINLGQGAALQTGMEFGIKINADYIVHFDADGQHNHLDIPCFIDYLSTNNVDVVLGSRFKKVNKENKIPVKRKLLLKFARIFNGIFTGIWLTDAHNGFRALNRKAFTSIIITENRMAHATEILQIIKNKKLKYIELPTNVIYNEYTLTKGQSNLNAINIVIDLLIKKFL